MSGVIQGDAPNDTLDARQRDMLEAMGIKLWQPEPVIAPAPASLAAPASFAPSVLAEDLEHKLALPLMNSAQSAIENRAPTVPQMASSAAPVARVPRPDGVAQMDWQTLQDAVSGCQACGLCASRKNTVFGIGQPSAPAQQAPHVDWLIVGEAPGEQEDQLGEPFVGPAGKLLDNMLAAMKMGHSEDGQPQGLTRQKGVYITNVLKCRPPANRNPSSEEVATCEAYLVRQIELLRPKIIVAMGKFAIQTLTGHNDPVGKLRGRVHPLQHPSYAAPVIVTYHPAYLLRNLPDKAKAWADLLLAMQTYRELPALQTVAAV
jgi:uracil-DNA glycosylase